MELEYHGRKLPYQIVRRKMKTIRVRIKTDGIIHVSAPHNVPESYIHSFLLEHAAELAELIDRAEAQQAAAMDHSDGAFHLWLGERITLRWVSAPRPPVLENGVLSLFARNEQEACTAYRQWMTAECTALYSRINREVCEAFRSRGYRIPFARIEIREMTSRWGSCTPESGRISINFKLMQYPVGCIYGVFYHEYAHFLHQNHSEEFYALLLALYPEYKQWDAILKAPLR